MRYLWIRGEDGEQVMEQRPVVRAVMVAVVLCRRTLYMGRWQENLSRTSAETARVRFAFSVAHLLFHRRLKCIRRLKSCSLTWTEQARWTRNDGQMVLAQNGLE